MGPALSVGWITRSPKSSPAAHSHTPKSRSAGRYRHQPIGRRGSPDDAPRRTAPQVIADKGLCAFHVPNRAERVEVPGQRFAKGRTMPQTEAGLPLRPGQTRLVILAARAHGDQSRAPYAPAGPGHQSSPAKQTRTGRCERDGDAGMPAGSAARCMDRLAALARTRGTARPWPGARERAVPRAARGVIA